MGQPEFKGFARVHARVATWTLCSNLEHVFVQAQLECTLWVTRNHNQRDEKVLSILLMMIWPVSMVFNPKMQLKNLCSSSL